MDTTLVLFVTASCLTTFIIGFVFANLKAREQQSTQKAYLRQITTESEQLEKEQLETEKENKALLDELTTRRITQEGLETQCRNRTDEIVKLENQLSQCKKEQEELRLAEQTARMALAKTTESAVNQEKRAVDKASELTQLQEQFEQLQEDQKKAIEVAAIAKEATSKLTEQQAKDSAIFKERLEEKDQRITTLQTKLAEASKQKADVAEQLSESQQSYKQALAQREEISKQLADYKQWWLEGKQALSQLQEKHHQLAAEYTELNTTLEQRERGFKEQFKLLEQNKEAMTKEFERIAQNVLEDKGKNFKEMNKESLTLLLNPIQSEMKDFKEIVEKSHKTESEQRILLKAELKHLQELNRDITDQAQKLTTALQGQKKIQGNWGELVLENVLDGSGLRLGEDYQREVSFTTEDGRQRPDAVVYLPQKKHMVIDAKTSLSAYTRFVNSTHKSEQQQALKEHTKAVSDRITELADRNYYQLPGLNSPEIVIMFIPIESAYVEALKHDASLYQRAIEQNVLVATPTTLLTSLNIVRQLWRFEDQSKHSAELAKRAEKFYNKLRVFLTNMLETGKRLDQAKSSYDQTLRQLHTGKGNLIKQAAEFKELGVAVKAELPQELIEKASLELHSESTH